MACRQAREAEELATSSAYPPQEQVEVSLKVEADIASDDLKAMTYTVASRDGRTAFPWLKRPSSDGTIPIHCVVRSDNPSDAPTFMTLPFKQKAGTLSLVYEGTGLVINAGDFTKTKGLSGRRWYMMGIIGGTPETDGAGKLTGKIKFRSTDTPLPRVALGGEGTADVPYTSGWVELELRTVNGETYLHGGALTRLRFRPRGALLRLQFRNELPYSHVQARQYITDAKYMDSHVDFSLNVPLSTNEASWSYAGPIAPRTYVLGEQTKDMPAQTTDDAYYLLWVMPDGSTNKGFASYANVRDRVRMRALGENEHTNDNPRLCPLGTYSPADRQSLADGKSYRLTVRIGANWNPLDDVTDYNLAGPYNAPYYMSNHANASVGFYEFELLKLINPKPIAGAHIPQLSELKTIFGGENGVWQFDPDATFTKTIEEDVRYRGQDFRHKSTYASNKSHLTAYGMRFQGSATAHGQNYTAWRYAVVELPENASEPATDRRTLVAKSLYLGPGAHETIEDTASEDWWNALPATAKAAVVTKYFPIAGAPFFSFETGSYRLFTRDQMSLWTVDWEEFPVYYGWQVYFSFFDFHAPSSSYVNRSITYYKDIYATSQCGIRLFKD